MRGNMNVACQQMMSLQKDIDTNFDMAYVYHPCDASLKSSNACAHLVHAAPGAAAVPQLPHQHTGRKHIRRPAEVPCGKGTTAWSLTTDGPTGTSGTVRNVRVCGQPHVLPAQAGAARLVCMQNMCRGTVCPTCLVGRAPSSMSSGAVWVMVPQLKVSMRDCTSSCRAMPKSATWHHRTIPAQTNEICQQPCASSNPRL